MTAYFQNGDFVHISDSNSKLGNILNFSTTPVVGCSANCYVCDKKCYALKSYNQYAETRNAWNNNLKAIKGNKKAIMQAIDIVLNKTYRTRKKVFRWYVSGDIVNESDLFMIDIIALKYPDWSFYLYTKNYDVVNDYILQNGYASNLTIIFSAWYPLKMDNPFNLPVAEFVPKGTEIPNKNNSIICYNATSGVTCDNCPCPCYHAKHGETIFLLEH